MPGVKSAAEREWAFREAIAKFRAAVEADGRSKVTVMATPRGSRTAKIEFTEQAEGWPAPNAYLLAAAQEWKQALDADGEGLTVTVIVRRGSQETVVIDTRE